MAHSYNCSASASRFSFGTFKPPWRLGCRRGRARGQPWRRAARWPRQTPRRPRRHGRPPHRAGSCRCARAPCASVEVFRRRSFHFLPTLTAHDDAVALPPLLIVLRDAHALSASVPVAHTENGLQPASDALLFGHRVVNAWRILTVSCVWLRPNAGPLAGMGMYTSIHRNSVPGGAWTITGRIRKGRGPTVST